MSTDVNKIAEWLDNIAQRESELGLWMSAGRIRQASELLLQQHRVLADAYHDFIAGQYLPGQCDCDPSVGLDECLVCKIRNLLEDLA